MVGVLVRPAPPPVQLSVTAPGDVLAGAPRTAGAMTAVGVYRQLPVAVPRLNGDSQSVATARLADRALNAKIVDVGGFFQSLIPGSSKVCQTVPPAGRLLAPGTQVKLQMAELC